MIIDGWRRWSSTDIEIPELTLQLLSGMTPPVESSFEVIAGKNKIDSGTVESGDRSRDQERGAL
ncbi:MAG TPA: hypothetical protein VGF01_18340, partial [Terracidiphilus sp.]